LLFTSPFREPLPSGRGGPRNINGGRLDMTSLTYGSRPRPERALAFATIAGLHALVIGLILSGFGRTAVTVLIGDLQAQIIDPPKTTEHPLPPPQPTFQRVKVDVPKPYFKVDDPPPANAISGEVAEPPLPVPQVASPAPEPIRLVGRHRLPNTDDYYPAAKIRDGIEGASVVKVCVDANGRRTGDPTVQQSSGDAGLDLGAQHVARDGRYARAMQGDQYVPNCYAFRIIFQVRKN
jgi:TonB family protein